MDQYTGLIADNCIASWIYTKAEWEHFDTWKRRQKSLVNYIWQFFSHKKEPVSSIQLTKTFVQIGDKRKYFTGPVTELRRVDIYDKGLINVMNITYENITKNQFKEISIPIPRGKLKEAIDIQETLMHEVRLVR